MGPLDYTSAFANVPSPQAAMLDGLKFGAGFSEMQAKRQQEAAALAQQKQMQADLLALSQNPTTQAIGAMSLKYPQLSEQFKRSYDMLEPTEQQSRLSSAAPVYAAVQNGRPDVAVQLLRERADALKNSGKAEEAQQTLTMADMVEKSPQQAKVIMGTMLAAVLGPDKFAENFGKIGDEQRAAELQPGKVREQTAQASKAESDAATAGVTAKYAEKGALLDLEKKGWDITKIKADIQIAKEDNRIKAMTAAAAREANALKRQELQIKIDEAIIARDTKIREKVAEAESAATNIDNMLNTITRVKQHADLGDVVGSIEGRMPVLFGDDNADAAALLETLGSQAFLSQLPAIKGMGQLSNAEGEKLQAALQNLGRVQSEKQLKANLTEAERILGKVRANVSKRYGVPLGNPDTPAAADKRPPLSSFNR